MNTNKKIGKVVSIILIIVATVALSLVLFVYIGSEIHNKYAMQMGEWFQNKYGTVLSAASISAVFVVFKMIMSLTTKLDKSNNYFVNSAVDSINKAADKIHIQPAMVEALMEGQTNLKNEMELLLQFLKIMAMNSNNSEDLNKLILALENTKFFKQVNEVTPEEVPEEEAPVKEPEESIIVVKKK